MIPNSLAQSFPSHRIAAEGRWGHEIIIQLLGGAGNQAVFNTLGMIVLVLNGFLFAEFMNVKTRAQRFIVAALVTLSPIFLEYLSFSIDAFPYAIGDMAALLGVIVLARLPAIWPQLAASFETTPAPFQSAAALASRIPPMAAAIIISAGLFTIALGIYQPKISLIAILLAFYLLGEFSMQKLSPMQVAQRIAAAATSFIAAILTYWISYKLLAVVSDSLGYNRTQVNSISDMVGHASASYGEIFRLVVGFVQSISPLTSLSLFILMGSAFVLVALRAFRNGLLQGLFSIALIALIPVGLRLTYVINQDTFADIARAMPSVALMAAFASAICLSRFKAVALIASLIVVWSSFTVLVQESSAAALKSWHETAMITRIVARVEPLLAQGDQNTLVVIGRPRFDHSLVVSAPDRPLRPQTKKPAYINYRQIALTNFLLGEERVISPNAEQRAHARRAAAGRAVWPAPTSVFRDGDLIVVLLDENYQAAEATR